MNHTAALQRAWKENRGHACSQTTAPPANLMKHHPSYLPPQFANTPSFLLPLPQFTVTSLQHPLYTNRSGEPRSPPPKHPPVGFSPGVLSQLTRHIINDVSTYLFNVQIHSTSLAKIKDLLLKKYSCLSVSLQHQLYY